MLRLLPFPLLAIAAAPAALLAAAPPLDAEGPWLVLSAPWRDAGALIAAAGGQAVGPEAAPLVLVATAEVQGFPARAAALGLIVIDARALPDFCGAM